MPANTKSSTVRLVLATLVPSPFSAIACLFVGIALIVIHVAFLSLDKGTILPSLFDGQWAISYTNIVVQPLQQVLHNNFFNQLLTILMWSAVGLIVYEAGAYLMRNYRGWREAQHDVQMVGTGLVQHPLRGNYLVRFLWRLALGVSFFIFLLLLNPLFKWLFNSDYHLFDGTLEANGVLGSLAVNVLVWALVAHGFVVFARLYAMRPRLWR